MDLSEKQGRFQWVEVAGELWTRRRGEGNFLPPSSSLLPPEGRFWKSPAGLGPGQLLCACRSLPAPQLSLCSQNSRGGGRGEEVVYLGGRWRRGIRAVPRERGSAGGAPVPLDLSFFGGLGAPVPPGLALSGMRGQRFLGTSTW